LTTTAIGHMLTALVIVGITPIAVLRISGNGTMDLEGFGSDEGNGIMERASISEIIPHDIEVSSDIESKPDEDVIELID